MGTGSGAIARVLSARRPDAAVLGAEVDPVAVACARRNGVEVAIGDLFDGVPASWQGRVDVVVGVLPYVPDARIAYLPRDVRTYGPIGALAGGEDGLTIVRRATTAARRWLRDGGHLLLEVGGDQSELLGPILAAAGFVAAEMVMDGDGDPRGIDAVALPGS